MYRQLSDNRFSFRTLDEGRLLANHLAERCPDPPSASIGLAELLFNAVEHGTLGLTYEQKSKLQEEDSLGEELERRLALPENAQKWVTVEVEERAGEIHFLVQDPGDGFDWRPYLVIDPKRRSHSHGRGIALAMHMSFSRLEYRGNGNTVLAVVSPEGQETGEPEPDEGRRRIKRGDDDRRQESQLVDEDQRKNKTD